MPILFSQRGQQRFDPKPFHEGRQSRGPVGGVPLQNLRLGTGSISWSANRRHGDDERQRDFAVGRIDRRSLDGQGANPARRLVDNSTKR